MDTEFIALASFVIVTTFTPGPNNISSASMGILYGYKKSFKYLLGISAGFFMVMIISGWVSATLLEVFPSFESALRIIGAVYILWLAWHTLKASYSFEEKEQILFGFSKGFFLQLLNPKGIIFGLTLYSTFLLDKVTSPVQLFLSAVVLAGVALAATSTWTLFGAVIRTYLNRPRVKQWINIALSLLLVYIALELSGLLDFLAS